MNDISPMGLLAIAASSILLLLAAGQRFNTPPTNRSGTTFALYYVGMFLYYSMIIAVWLCTIAFLASGGVSLIKLPLNDATKSILPLVAAFLVVVFSYSNYKSIRNLDEGARRFCLRLASIPLLAEQLTYELAHQAKFHVLSNKLKMKITDVISHNISPNAVNFGSDSSLSSRFTRAISLYWLFIEPHNNGTPLEFPVNSSTRLGYANIMKLGEKTVSQANDHYEKLMEIGAACFSSAKPSRQMEDSLKKVTNEISNSICSLIARFVLLQDKTYTQRRSRLLCMGFDHYDELPVFGATRWAILLFGIGIVTLVIVDISPRSVPLSIGDAFLRAIIFLMQMGISIAAGAFLARRFASRQGVMTGLMLLFELIIACLIVFTISSALRIGFSFVSATLLKPHSGKGDFGEILREFVNRWSVVMFPVANTISITIACIYLTALSWTRSSMAVIGAIWNGLVFAMTGLIVGVLLPETVLTELNTSIWMARLTIMLDAGVIGAVAGAMVLAMFKRTKQVDNSPNMTGAEKNGKVYQVDVSSPPKGEWADKAFGGYSRENAEELEGTYVCFRPMFTKPEFINAYLVKIRWDAKQSCLTFEETDRADSAHIQQGKVYIPFGKPFMNLVTNERGDVRLIMVSRPDSQGVARGLIMTLSLPGGVNYIPASVPIVLRRVGKQELPRLGFVKPEDPEYSIYQKELLGVLPAFGVLAQPMVTSS